MNKTEKLIAVLLGLATAGWMWYSISSQKKAAEAAAQYAQEHDCAVLAIWDCGELPELTGECETLSDGGRLYAVDAATLETLLSVYQTEYPMESYAPAGEAVSAAAVLYD